MKDRKPWSFCETPEEKCTMNYCDEKGCQNRKRNYVQGNDLIADVSTRLIPDNLVMKGGCHILRLDIFNDFREKPTAKLTCIDDDTHTIDLDGDWIEESTEGCFYLTSEKIDVLIEKLKEAKNFLNGC